MIAVFLQNSWRHGGQPWPSRKHWLYALYHSRSGKRLRILAEGLEVAYHNTTPQVGRTPSSRLRPDAWHIQQVLNNINVSEVVACGKQAEAALTPLWSGPLLVVPHPAARLLTDELYREANYMLRNRKALRDALRQERGHWRLEVIE